MRTGGWLGAVALAVCCDGSSAIVGEIPPEPDVPPTTSSAVSTFAIRNLFLGDTDRSGDVAPTAWTAFGFDLDGLVTGAGSTNVCSLQPGAPLSVQVDGENGIDDAWGAELLPLLETTFSFPSPSETESLQIVGGDWTLQIQITGLSDDLGQTAVGLAADVFVSGALGAVPAFDATTRWPVLPSSLADGATVAGGAIARFSQVYVSNGIVVAAGADALTIPLVIDLEPFPLHVRHPLLVLSRSTATLATGTIGGVLDPDEITQTFVDAVHELKISACGSGLDPMLTQITQSEDILSNVTNQPGVACNAISIGVGFVASLVANPTDVGDDGPPPPNPCDAGTDADAD